MATERSAAKRGRKQQNHQQPAVIPNLMTGAHGEMASPAAPVETVDNAQNLVLPALPPLGKVGEEEEEVGDEVGQQRQVEPGQIERMQRPPTPPKKPNRKAANPLGKILPIKQAPSGEDVGHVTNTQESMEDVVARRVALERARESLLARRAASMGQDNVLE